MLPSWRLISTAREALLQIISSSDVTEYPASDGKLRVGADADQLYDVGTSLAVDKDQVGPQMTVTTIVVLSLEPRRMSDRVRHDQTTLLRATDP